jgi:hypothetical protein
MEDFEKTAKNSTEDPNSKDTSSKLCMEIIEDRWTKQTGGTPTQFEDAIRKQLNATDVSREELNKLYEDAVKTREVTNHGSAGNGIFDNAIKAWNCK